MIESSKPNPRKTRLRPRDQTEATNSQARKTALVVAVVLFLIALWNIHKGRVTLAAVLAGVSGVLVVIGLFVSFAARGFHRFWMGIAGVLGYVNSRILLSLLYYGVLTPVGLARRLIGRDPMRRRGPAEESYWLKREHPRQTKEQFERLF